MKKFLSWALMLILCIQCVGISSTAFAAENAEIAIYCAPNGDDSAAGTIDAPLASLEGAREMVRRLKNKNPNTPITVYFRGGEYTDFETAYFEEDDSGTESAPITYKAYENEQPIIYGATKIKASDFVPVSGKTKQRVPEESRNYVGVADLKALGIRHLTEFEGFGGGHRNQSTEFIEELENTYIPFIYNGQEQLMAQWPNGIENYAATGTVYDARLSFSVDTKGRMQNWTQAKHAVVQGRMSYGYTYSRVRVESFDPSLDKITTVNEIPRNVQTGKEVQVANLLEELDVPGEYYVDTDELKLYFYPPYKDDNAVMELVTNEKRIAFMNDASYITFDGIDFHKNRAEIFEIRNCDNIKFLGCEFRNNTVMGIDTRYSTNILVDGCDFISQGSTSVRFDERYDDHLDYVDKQSVRVDLTPDNNVVNNCYFYDIAPQGVMYTGAIRVHGVGNSITRNSFHNARNSVIHHGGNDLSILNNEMWQGMKTSLDMGMIYNGRQVTQRGNEMAYNYFHDWGEGVSNLPFAGHAYAIYDDDCLTGNNKHHNYFVSGHVPFQTSGTVGGRFNHNAVIQNLNIGHISAHGTKEAGTWWGSMRDFVNQQIAQVYTLPQYEKYEEIKELFFMDVWPLGSTTIGNLLLNNLPGRNYNNAKTSEDNIEIYDDNEAYYEYFNNPEIGDYTIRTDIEVPEELKEYQKVQLKDVGIYESETRETADYSLTPFKAYYPYVYQDDVASKGAYFAWERSEHADRYILEIANDPDFRQIIREENCLFNFAYLTDLSADKTVYYWRVTAVNDSVVYPEKLMCTNDVMVFRTNRYDVLDKSLLEKQIAETEAFIKTIVEGTESGQAAYGSIADITELLEEAKKMMELKSGDQLAIDQMALALENKISDIRKTTSVYYTDISNMFKPESAYKQNTNASVKKENNVITLKTTTADAMSAFSDISTPLEYDKLLRFDLNIGVRSGFSDSQWAAIVLTTLDNAGLRSWQQTGCKSLMMVIKASAIELQIRDGVHSNLVLSGENPLRLGEFNEIEMGILNVVGGQLYIFKVNGEALFYHYETERILTDTLYFAMHDTVKGEGTSIRMLDYKEPQLYLGTQVSFGNVNISELMGSSSVSVSNGTKFSKEKAPNDYTISASVNVNDKAAQGIIFRSSNPDLNGNYYQVAFENGTIMLKEKNNSAEQIVALYDMGDIKSNALVEINARNVIEGLNITVEIDGKCYIDYVDKTPLANSGYLGIFSNSAAGFTLNAQ